MRWKLLLPPFSKEETEALRGSSIGFRVHNEHLMELIQLTPLVKC